MAVHVPLTKNFPVPTGNTPLELLESLRKLVLEVNRAYKDLAEAINVNAGESLWTRDLAPDEDGFLWTRFNGNLIITTQVVGAEGGEVFTLRTNYLSVTDFYGNQATFSTGGIAIQDDDGNKISISPSGITLEGSAVIIKGGDTWPSP